jgi:hypothetical protein
MLKYGAKIGKISQEFLILSRRKLVTGFVGIYDIKSLVPKYANHNLQLRTIHFQDIESYANAMYCLLIYDNGL